MYYIVNKIIISIFLLINNTLDGLFDDIFIEFILALVALHTY